jgi:hypothetical protein
MLANGFKLRGRTVLMIGDNAWLTRTDGQVFEVVLS